MKTFLKKILPETARRGVSRLREEINAFAKRLVGKVPLVRWAAYATSPHFSADFRAFVVGARLYSIKHSVDGPNIPLLRRNIHRIEKGINHPQRRSSFATDYILETVLVFDQLRMRSELRGRSEIVWAQSVLAKYFDITNCEEHDYVIAAQVFRSEVEPAGIVCVEPTVEYRNTATADDFGCFQALLTQRKSIRKYSDEPVPDAVIDNALWAASRAPSSCNRQPYKYYILKDCAKVHAAAEISAGTMGWVDEIRLLAVVVADTSYFMHAVNRHSIYVDSTLSVMPFILSLEAQGYSSCLINWADDRRRRKRMETILGLSPHQRVIISIAIGRADMSVTAPSSIRKYTSEISKHDE